MELPNEIIAIIASYLNNRDERLMRVNKLFYEHLNRKKCSRFQLIKNTLFNYLIEFQYSSSKYLTTKIDRELFNVYYGSELRYNFCNIYDKCIFNHQPLYFERHSEYATVKNLYIVHNIPKKHILLYFDIFYFDMTGDLCFKIYEYHKHPKNNDTISDCSLCSKLSISKSFKVERIKDNDLYKDFSININDDNCLEKLHILFSSVFSNFGTPWCSTPYDVLHHNSKSDNFMFDEIELSNLRKKISNLRDKSNEGK